MSIFLDHAATTPMDPRVKEVVGELLARPLNASSVHWHGQRARGLLERAREELAALVLGPGRSGKVVFTASATEANNLVLRSEAGRAAAMLRRPLRVASSPLEHACVRSTLADLTRRGSVEVSLMTVSPDGMAEVASLTQEPDLLCLMAVQNESGVIQALADAVALRARTGSRWLCDVTQALGFLDDVPEAREADFLTMSSHKIYGPPGVGAVVGAGVDSLTAQITGGPQEEERRAGTQPVALIVGFLEAVRLAVAESAQRRQHLRELEAAFLGRLHELAVPYQLNGAEAQRLPGFLNISVQGFKGADLVIALEAKGFSTSSGSACSTGVMEVSPAMAAMFPADAERAAGALRITPGKGTSVGELIACAEALGALVARRKK